MFYTSNLPLRLWVLITGLAGLSASVSAFLKPGSPHATLYRLSKQTIHPSFARMYATWLLTSTAIRVTFFFSPSILPSDPIFPLTLTTYFIALLHFFLEIFVHKTVALKPAGIAPLVVASVSIVWFAGVAVLSD